MPIERKEGESKQAYLQRCIRTEAESGKPEDQAAAICHPQFEDKAPTAQRNDALQFVDRATLDTKTKRVVSMRDGVLEYLGAEIGREPEDEIFTVYRSPSTVANAAFMTTGIPITDGHVATNEPAPETGSYLTDSALIDQKDDALLATMAARHTAEVTEDLVASIESGKRQVSLGYTGELVEHPEYGLEQVNIVPHHLAVEEAGRCGPSCSFIDHRAPNGESAMTQKQTSLPQAFLDENGETNMQQIVEIASALPEAIKSVPIEKLQEVMPQLQELVSIAGKGQEQGGEEGSAAEEGSDADYSESGEEEEEEMGDKGTKDKAPQGYTDAQVKKFVDAQVQAETKRHAATIEKARQFLPDTYDFTDKSTEEIMRDAVATETTESFSNSELPMAFKMLKPTQRRAEIESFGDRQPDGASQIDKLANEEL